MATSRIDQTPVVLVMMSGLPGVGKSSLARALAVRLRAAVVSVDPIEDAMVRSGIPMSFETGVAAYEVGATVAVAQLRAGLPVIADAANLLEVGRDMWRAAAAPTGARMSVIEVVCSDQALHRRRLEARERGLTAYPEPSWHDVMRRAAGADPWTVDRLVVDTVRPLDELVEQAVAYLAS